MIPSSESFHRPTLCIHLLAQRGQKGALQLWPPFSAFRFSASLACWGSDRQWPPLNRKGEGERRLSQGISGGQVGWEPGLCIWAHPLKPVHLPHAASQPRLQTGLPLPMKVLNTEVEWGRWSCLLSRELRNSSLEQELPRLQLKRCKEGAWDRTRSRPSGDSVRKAGQGRATGQPEHRKRDKFLCVLHPTTDTSHTSPVTPSSRPLTPHPHLFCTCRLKSAYIHRGPATRRALGGRLHKACHVWQCWSHFGGVLTANQGGQVG